MPAFLNTVRLAQIRITEKIDPTGIFNFAAIRRPGHSAFLAFSSHRDARAMCRAGARPVNNLHLLTKFCPALPIKNQRGCFTSGPPPPAFPSATHLKFRAWRSTSHLRMIRSDSQYMNATRTLRMLLGICLFAAVAGAVENKPDRQHANIHQLGIYLSPGDGHWVKSKTADGSIVVLEDRSVWEIDLFDRLDTALWLPITNITVVEITAGYLLINTDDGEKAHAKLLAP